MTRASWTLFSHKTRRANWGVHNSSSYLSLPGRVSSGSGKRRGFFGGGTDVGSYLAGGRGSGAHRGGRDDGIHCMIVLISETLVLFLYHRTRVASLMVNSTRLVPSSKARLLRSLALMLLYSESTSLHLEV